MSNCVFCRQEEILLQNDFAWAKYDLHPVSAGHLLIITKRHVEDFFAATLDERQAINNLLQQAKELLDSIYSPDGYNIGINCGDAAGQTIMHLHVHLIPRYRGDIENPRGGVRGAIPDKRVY